MTAVFFRGELWIDEDGRLCVDDEDGRRCVDNEVATRVTEDDRARLGRPGEKYLGWGNVYVFAGRDEWTDFRERVNSAYGFLVEGKNEEARRALEGAWSLVNRL